MPLPEFTLHDFNKIASGEYNAGQIDFVTSDNGRVSLAKINNHVHKTGLNKTTLSAARILEVKEAFVSALRREGHHRLRQGHRQRPELPRLPKRPDHLRP